MADSSLPAARCSGPPDKIFIRDLVLDCRIGVHDAEKSGSQRVRFSVEIAVHSSAKRPPASIEEVISYDFITGGIRRIVAQAHIVLAETLAERVAEHCLSDPRAKSVRVRVEKLDRIPGAAFGVEIIRRQPGSECRGDDDTNPNG